MPDIIMVVEAVAEEIIAPEPIEELVLVIVTDAPNEPNHIPEPAENEPANEYQLVLPLEENALVVITPAPVEELIPLEPVYVDDPDKITIFAPDTEHPPLLNHLFHDTDVMLFDAEVPFVQGEMMEIFEAGIPLTPVEGVDFPGWKRQFHISELEQALFREKDFWKESSEHFRTHTYYDQMPYQMPYQMPVGGEFNIFNIFDGDGFIYTKSPLEQWDEYESGDHLKADLYLNRPDGPMMESDWLQSIQSALIPLNADIDHIYWPIRARMFAVCKRLRVRIVFKRETAKVMALRPEDAKMFALHFHNSLVECNLDEIEILEEFAPAPTPIGRFFQRLFGRHQRILSRFSRSHAQKKETHHAR